MRIALAPLLFYDEELGQNRKTRDAVAPATPSESAKKKKCQRTTTDGLNVQSFKTLMVNLGSRTRNRCRFNDSKTIEHSIVHQLTELTPLQKKAYELLNIVPSNKK